MIVVVPADTPVTTPVVSITEAMPGRLLLQVPPVVASAKVVVELTHTLSIPVIAKGNGSTVISWVTKHPVFNVYVINAVPRLIPCTTPVEEPTVATNVLLLLQLPPFVPSLRVFDVPRQTLKLPLINNGKGFTVTTTVTLHPVPMV